MEKAGGSEEPATRAAGGMCDRFLTFLARNLTMSRMKSVAEGGPRNGAGGGHPTTEGEGEDEDEDEFAIPIERAEFDFEFGGHGGGGHSTAATILGEGATTTRGLPEQMVAAIADGPVSAGPAPPAVEETKVRRSVTIKEDRPAAEQQDQGGAAPATVERKKSLFKKRQVSSAGGGGEEQGGGGPRVPRRSGLRPRMLPMPRVPTNINEMSSTFIDERKKGFGGSGKPAPPDK